MSFPERGSYRGSIGTKRRRWRRRYGGCWRIGPVVGRVRHAITYRVLELEVREGCLEESSFVAEGPEAAWVRSDELVGLARSSLVDKVLSCLE